MVSATPPNSPSSSSCSRRDGNHNIPSSSINPAKHWCFTWNNYPQNWADITAVPEIESYVLGKEVGEEKGTPHIQGYIKFKDKLRPLNLFPKGIHWEVCRNIQASIDYCAKDGDYLIKNICLPSKVKTLNYDELYPWQANIVNNISLSANDRTINWFWETTGGVGKTALCKYLCVHHQALICSGKASDMKYLIVKYKEKYGDFPKVIIMDIPRSSLDYVSYTGIEEIKNGLFCSSKYECEMVVMNSPHVLVFANEEPKYDEMSADRWSVEELVPYDPDGRIEDYENDRDYSEARVMEYFNHCDERARQGKEPNDLSVFDL